MQIQKFVFYAALFISFQSLGACAKAGDLTEACLEESCAERVQVVQLVNEERGQAGSQRVQLDGNLSQIAQTFAIDMETRGYFSHTTPEGQTMRMRLENGNADYGYAGENIARGQRSCSDVMNSWMDSPGHRANILKPQFKRIGIGHAGQVWVQVFTD